jgi:hypothetical protein
MRNFKRDNLGLRGLPGALLVVFLMLSPGLAQAAVVASGQITVNIPNGESLYINMVTGDVGASGAEVPGWDFFIGAGLTLTTNFSDTSAGFATRISGIPGVHNLPLGFEMSTSVVLVPSDVPTHGQADYNWEYPGDSNYVGIYFRNEGTGTYHLGWVRFCFSGGSSDQPRALVEYAYEDVADAAIDIGEGGSGLPSDCGGSGCTTAAACGLAEDIDADGTDCLELTADASCSVLTFQGDLDYQEPGRPAWENVTWLGDGGVRVPASLASINPPLTYRLITRTLSLQDVDFDPAGFYFTFRGTDPAITLNGASLISTETDQFSFESAAAITATGSGNVLEGLIGNFAQATTLTVGSGADLEFLLSGRLGPGHEDQERVNFQSTDNNAVIDGGVLALQSSHVIFGTQFGEMLIQNGGQLQLNGSDTTLETENLRVNASNVAVGGFAKLEPHTLNVENATIDIEPDGQISSSLLNVYGTNTTITLGAQSDPQAKAYTLSSAIGMDADGAVLTLTGGGPGAAVAAPALIFIEPNTLVRITDGADLDITGSLGSAWTRGSVEVGATGLLQILEGGRVASSIPIQNDGAIRVQGSFQPTGNMTGTGSLQVTTDGILGPLGTSANGTFTCDPSVVMDFQSQFKWLFSPAQGLSQKLVANSTVNLSNLAPGAILDPIIVPDEDVALPAGTKFVVIDYPAEGDLTGRFMRSDGTPLNEGDEITIGLNNYRISYLDPDYDPANPTVVTLTANGEPVATFLTMVNVENGGEGNSLVWSVKGPAEPGLFSVFREEDRNGRFENLESAIIDRRGDEFRFVDGDTRPGSTYRYRVNTNIGGQSTVLFTTDFVAVPGFKFALDQNHPNPFNPSTTISFTLSEESTVSLRVYDVAGRLVKDLIPNEGLPAGKKDIVWNGTDAHGKLVSTGVYFYVLDTGTERATRRMALVK